LRRTGAELNGEFEFSDAILSLAEPGCNLSAAISELCAKLMLVIAHARIKRLMNVFFIIVNFCMNDLMLIAESNLNQPDTFCQRRRAVDRFRG
jgi:hypothetical protein